METRYIVKVTDFAIAQLLEIRDYISVVLGEPTTAKKLLNTLETEMASLSRFPHRIVLTDEEPWHSCGIHKMMVKNFIIYFWIDEESKKVQVTAVVYGRRNQREQLDAMPMQ